MEYINIDESICTGCQECTKVCPTKAIEGEHGKPQTINRDKCIRCGQCVQKCKACLSPSVEDRKEYYDKLSERELPKSLREPLFAAYNMSRINAVREALDNPSKVCVVHAAPAVRAALGEEFGIEPGSDETGRMISALYELGFSHVYDANFAADLTIMEEGTELINRVKNGGTLPMITSCCPGWISYIEKNFPNLTDHLSTCKSPQQMQGAIEKTYGAEKLRIDRGSMYTVSVMPCTAKAFESAREEMWDSGNRDIDAVLTTRELAYLIKEKGIDYKNLPEKKPESVLGNYSGAGAIFGVTGGVMEAAIRTGYELITGNEIPDVQIPSVRGKDGVRYASVKAGDLELKVCVVTGLANVEPVLRDIESGKSAVHFIEVMACPEGCISGGGQPKLLMDIDREEVFAARRKALYNHDEKAPIRKSHENPDVKALYDDFLGEIGGEKAHHLLHTTYNK